MLQSPSDVENLAHAAWDSGDLALAFKLFFQGAALGIGGCMHDLGYLYDEGIGTPQDKARAMYWYKRAYRKGSSAAATNIAILYQEQGRSRLAFQWLRRAATLGDGDAQVDLAKLYIRGKGVRRCPAKAITCLRAAMSPTVLITEAGQAEAVELLREIEHAD